MIDTTSATPARIDGSFDPVAFISMVAHHGHSGEIGMRYSDHGEDWVEIAMPWREELVGVVETGVLATGAIVSLVDVAGGASVWLKRRRFVPAVTLDLRIDYLRPGKKGETVYARCRCIKFGRSVAFVDGIAHVGNPDDPIARAALTFMPT